MAIDNPYSTGFEGRGLNLVIFSGAFCLWAFALILSRLYFRHKFVGRLGKDDYAILFSMAFSCALTTFSIMAVSHGYGKPSTQLREKELHASLFFFYLVQIFYKATIACTKLSILLLYLRIFPGRNFRLLDYSLIFFVFGYALCSIVATILQCEPIHSAWERDIPGNCTNLRVSWYVNGGADMLGDLLILLLPMRPIYHLRLPTREKHGLILIFGLGGFVCVTSALRVVTLKLGSKSIDPNRGTLASTIWTIVEANTGIICACLPMLKTPLAKLFPTLFPTPDDDDTPSNTTSRLQISGGNPGSRSFDQARPGPSTRTATNNSTSDEAVHKSIRKTTMIDVEYSDQGYQLVNLPPIIASHDRSAVGFNNPVEPHEFA